MPLTNIFIEPPDKINDNIGIFKIIHSQLQPTKAFTKKSF
jgi:hypothetical protein